MKSVQIRRFFCSSFSCVWNEYRKIRTRKNSRKKTFLETFHAVNYLAASNPGGTQSPEDVPLWSYFGRDVLDHNRTKIGRIRFLTCFGSAVSGMHLALGNIEKSP